MKTYASDIFLQRGKEDNIQFLYTKVGKEATEICYCFL